MEANDRIEELAGKISEALSLPEKAEPDAAHLAFAVYYEMDYLMTWNCAHLANGRTLRRLADYVRTEGLWLPVIATPEEMLEE